jgi:ribosomal protein S18 acetylase RimI-like enzyme
MEIFELTSLSGYEKALQDLMRNAVESGASIGFVLPVSDENLESYWQGVAHQLDTGALVLLVAREDDRIIGTIQLALATRPNSRHRAEVQKLMVHTDYRRRGIGAALLEAVEAEARQRRRSLLVLDTESTSDAPHLYRKHGWIEAGTIPNWALTPNHEMHATTFFYKQLATPAPQHK